MFCVSGGQAGWKRGASATFLDFSNEIEPLLFGCEFVAGGGMNSLAGAGQQRGVDLGGLLAKQGAIASAKLFFQFGNACEELFDELMAIVYIIWKFRLIFRVELWWLVWHDYFRRLLVLRQS